MLIPCVLMISLNFKRKIGRVNMEKDNCHVLSSDNNGLEMEL